MTATIITLPDPIRLRAGFDAVRERAGQTGATPEALRVALQATLRAMQDGRSTAFAVALANSKLANRRAPRGNNAA